MKVAVGLVALAGASLLGLGGAAGVAAWFAGEAVLPVVASALAGAFGLALLGNSRR